MIPGTVSLWWLLLLGIRWRVQPRGGRTQEGFHLFHLLDLGRPVENGTALEQFDDHASRGPQIDGEGIPEAVRVPAAALSAAVGTRWLIIRRCRGKEEELGGPVPQRDHGRGHVRILLRGDSGEPKVAELEPSRGGIVQQIARLDVAVDEPVRMAKAEGGQQLAGQGFDDGQRKGRVPTRAAPSSLLSPMVLVFVPVVGIENLGEVVPAVLEDQKDVGRSDLDRRSVGFGVLVAAAAVLVLVAVRSAAAVPVAHGNFQQIYDIGMGRTDSECVNLPKGRDRKPIGGLVVGVALLESNYLVRFRLVVVATVARGGGNSSVPAATIAVSPRVAGTIHNPVRSLADASVDDLPVSVGDIGTDSVV